jgi:hypothetical protein
MIVDRSILSTLAERLRSKYNRFVFHRKLSKKFSSAKNSAQVTMNSTFQRLPGLPGLRCAGLAAWLAVFLLLATVASAAEVSTKDRELEGSVVGVSAEGVVFETIYGKGTLVIQWSDIESIRSDKEFLVLYGVDQKAVGRIWGLENHELIVGESRTEAARIPVGEIHRLTREQYEKSPLERLRARYRYWSANFDLAFALTQATTDTTSFSTSLELRRKKTPTDFSFGAYYF